jgi:hypothetical protein
MHCGSGYGYNQNYFGGGQNYFGNGGGWAPVAPAYSQYQGPRYYNNGWNNAYRANRAHSWRERLFHHDHKGHHEHH